MMKAIYCKQVYINGVACKKATGSINQEAEFDYVNGKRVIVAIYSSGDILVDESASKLLYDLARQMKPVDVAIEIGDEITIAKAALFYESSYSFDGDGLVRFQFRYGQPVQVLTKAEFSNAA